MGVFAYSDVDNAASHALGAKVDAETIAERRDRLMAMQRRISARRLRRFVGQKAAGPGRRARRKDTELVWEARLEGMAPEIDGKLYLSDLEPPAGGRAGASPATWSRWRSPHRTTTIWSAASIEVREAVAPRSAAAESPPPAQNSHRRAAARACA